MSSIFWHSNCFSAKASRTYICSLLRLPNSINIFIFFAFTNKVQFSFCYLKNFSGGGGQLSPTSRSLFWAQFRGMFVFLSLFPFWNVAFCQGDGKEMLGRRQGLNCPPTNYIILVNPLYISKYIVDLKVNFDKFYAKVYYI